MAFKFPRDVGQEIYDAIVDAAGNADYTTIKGAFDAGHRSILIKEGSYNITEDIYLMDTTTADQIELIGEGKVFINVNVASGTNDAIFDFSTNAVDGYGQCSQQSWGNNPTNIQYDSTTYTMTNLMDANYDTKFSVGDILYMDRLEIVYGKFTVASVDATSIVFNEPLPLLDTTSLGGTSAYFLIDPPENTKSSFVLRNLHFIEDPGNTQYLYGVNQTSIFNRLIMEDCIFTGDSTAEGILYYDKCMANIQKAENCRFEYLTDFYGPKNLINCEFIGYESDKLVVQFALGVISNTKFHNCRLSYDTFSPELTNVAYDRDKLLFGKIYDCEFYNCISNDAGSYKFTEFRNISGEIYDETWGNNVEFYHDDKYDAVVSPYHYKYNTIQDAIADGHEIIGIKPGSYTYTGYVGDTTSKLELHGLTDNPNEVQISADITSGPVFSWDATELIYSFVIRNSTFDSTTNTFNDTTDDLSLVLSVGDRVVLGDDDLHRKVGTWTVLAVDGTSLTLTEPFPIRNGLVDDDPGMYKLPSYIANGFGAQFSLSNVTMTATGTSNNLFDPAINNYVVFKRFKIDNCIFDGPSRWRMFSGKIIMANPNDVMISNSTIKNAQRIYLNRMHNCSFIGCDTYRPNYSVFDWNGIILENCDIDTELFNPTMDISFRNTFLEGTFSKLVSIKNVNFSAGCYSTGTIADFRNNKTPYVNLVNINGMIKCSDGWLSLGSEEFGRDEFDAVVGMGGEFETIQEAFAAGHSKLFIKNGSYTISGLTGDMYEPTVAEHLALVGESPGGVTITINDSFYLFDYNENSIGLGSSFQIGSSATLFADLSTKTIGSSSFDATTAGLAVGQEMFIGNRSNGMLTVASFDATSITFEEDISFICETAVGEGINKQALFAYRKPSGALPSCEFRNINFIEHSLNNSYMFRSGGPDGWFDSVIWENCNFDSNANTSGAIFDYDGANIYKFGSMKNCTMKNIISCYDAFFAGVVIDNCSFYHGNILDSTSYSSLKIKSNTFNDCYFDNVRIEKDSYEYGQDWFNIRANTFNNCTFNKTKLKGFLNNNIFYFDSKVNNCRGQFDVYNSSTLLETDVDAIDAPKGYDAVISSYGIIGDYSSLKFALDAGHRNIAFMPGTYTESSTIYSATDGDTLRLVGEGPRNSVELVLNTAGGDPIFEWGNNLTDAERISYALDSTGTAIDTTTNTLYIDTTDNIPYVAGDGIWIGGSTSHTFGHWTIASVDNTAKTITVEEDLSTVFTGDVSGILIYSYAYTSTIPCSLMIDNVNITIPSTGTGEAFTADNGTFPAVFDTIDIRNCTWRINAAERMWGDVIPCKRGIVSNCEFYGDRSSPYVFRYYMGETITTVDCKFDTAQPYIPGKYFNCVMENCQLNLFDANLNIYRIAFNDVDIGQFLRTGHTAYSLANCLINNPLEDPTVPASGQSLVKGINFSGTTGNLNDTIPLTNLFGPENRVLPTVMNGEGLEIEVWHPFVLCATGEGSFSATIGDGCEVIGHRIIFKDNDGEASNGNITIIAPSGSNIDGSASIILNSDYSSVTLAYVAANSWRII